MMNQVFFIYNKIDESIRSSVAKCKLSIAYAISLSIRLPIAHATGIQQRRPNAHVNWIPIELSIAYAASPIGFPIGLPIRLSTAQIELPIGHAITHATGILIERPIAHAIDVIGVLIGDAIDVIGVLIRDAIAHAIDAIGILIGDTIRILIVITILRLATKSLLMRIIYIYNLLNRY